MTIVKDSFYIHHIRSIIHIIWREYKKGSLQSIAIFPYTNKRRSTSRGDVSPGINIIIDISMNFAAGLQIHPLWHECGIRAATTLPSSPPSVSEFTCCYATSRDIVACATNVCAWSRQRRRVSTAPLSTVAAVADRQWNRRYRIGQTWNRHESHATSLSLIFPMYLHFVPMENYVLHIASIYLYINFYFLIIGLLSWKKLLGKIQGESWGTVFLVGI